MPDWEDLIDRLRQRDPAAPELIYEAYHQRLYLGLLKGRRQETLHHLECVESGIGDALQELFRRPEIFDPDRSQSPGDPLLNFLFGMARRRVIDCRRKLSKDVLTREQLQSLDDDYLAESVSEADPGDNDDPVNTDGASSPNNPALADAIEALVTGVIEADEFYWRVLIHAEFRQLDEVVARLKPQLFVAWFMKYYVDLPVRDIAHILNVTEDTIDGMLRRARAALRGKDNSKPD